MERLEGICDGWWLQEEELLCKSDKDAFDPAVMSFFDSHQIDGADFENASEYDNLGEIYNEKEK